MAEITQDQAAGVAPPTEANPSMGMHPELRPIAQAVQAGGKDPQANLAASDAIKRKSIADEEGHVNTQAQWGAVVANLLQRNYKGALTAYNGGPTVDVEGHTADGKKFYKRYNERGYAGVMADEKGNVLTPEEQQNVVNKLGDVYTKHDETMLQSGLFKGLQASKLAAMSGISLQNVTAMKNSYDTNLKASALTNNTKELQSLTGKIKKKGYLDLITNAPADIRQAIFGYTQNQATQSNGQTAGGAASTNASSTAGSGGNANLGGSAGGSFNADGTPKVGVTGSLGGNAQNSSTVSQNKNLETGTTSNNANTAQANIESKILGYIQGNIGKDPEGVSDVMRWIQLSGVVNNAQQSLENSAQLPPGFVPVPHTLLGSTDSKSVFENTSNIMRNAALAGAWAAFNSHVVKNNRQNEDPSTLLEEFKNSNTYKGIQNTFDHDVEAARNGKQNEIKEGTIHVNSQNKPVIFINGKWEKLNER